MSNFEVNYSKLNIHSKEVDSIYKLLESIKQQIDSSNNNLRNYMPSSSYINIKNSLNAVSGSLQEQLIRIKSLSNGLERVSSTYSRTEAGIKSSKISLTNINGATADGSSNSKNDSWFDLKNAGEKTSSFFEFFSKILGNKEWFDNKFINQAAKLGLIGSVFSYITGLYSFMTGDYKDGLDLSYGVLGFLKKSGSMWTGLYKYYDKTLSPFQAGRLGKVFQTKAGVISLAGNLFGFTKEGINTYKLFSDENSEGYERLNQILKNATSGLDVAESGFALKYGQKVLSRDVTAKYVWGLSSKNASKMGNASAAISIAKVAADTFIGGNTKYHEVSKDGFVSMDDMGDVLMSGSIRGLTSIVDTATLGLIDVKDYTENISSGLKNAVVDPATIYAVNSPVSRAYIESASGWHEFANNPNNPEWQRWGVSVVSGIGMIGAMATDVATTPYRLIYAGAQAGYRAITNR